MKLKLYRNIHNICLYKKLCLLLPLLMCSWRYGNLKWILSKLLSLIDCHGNRRSEFAKKCKKIISSEAIMGMKLKHCRNVHNISLYKSYVFCCCCLRAFIAMATWSFHRLEMGISMQVFWQKFFRNVCWVVFYQTDNFLSEPLNFFGCHGNQKVKFAKSIKKINSSYKGDKAENFAEMFIALPSIT